VPTTFAKLVQSVHRLGLNDRVHPIAAAVLDDPRQVCLSYSLANSLCAPGRTKHLEPRKPQTRTEQRDVSPPTALKCATVKSHPRQVARSRSAFEVRIRTRKLT
jgi:hypothetical protein